jgi:riboflavin kinase/FMN adenylyltransferase
VIALGVFDGVHVGHRLILSQAIQKARVINGTSIVVTFSPHPQKEGSIYSLDHRLRILSELGIDVCVVIAFTRAFSNLSAEDFIKKILVQKLHGRYIYVGKNFRFGKRAAGDRRLLKKYSRGLGFRVRVFAVKRIHGFNISSTLIRRLIARGRLAAAQQLLSRRVSIFGTVIKGISLATKLGFPTANIETHHEVVPPPGVYIVDVMLGSKKFHGICNIGFRPSLAGLRRRPQAPHIEVHIFNFRKNIYGSTLEIHFLQYLRKEKNFAHTSLLAAQVKKDVQAAKKYFSRHSF